LNRRVALALAAAGAALLFWRLDRPLLWQDEAETALRGVTVLETGLPRESHAGVLLTAQPTLAAHEARDGVWVWNTWLPAYLAAASMGAFGRNAFAARLPFALAALLTLWLSWRLFTAAESDEIVDRRPWAAEAGLALLALSPAYLLFGRQARYYALGALGCALTLGAWRRLLAGRPWGALALALSLQLLFHSFFALFAVAALALLADAFLRLDECPRAGRFWGALLLTAALTAPAAWYWRVWSRPGNHAYGLLEGLEFLKTFLLWISLFFLPFGLLLAELLRARRPAAALLAFALLAGLCGEGGASRLAAAAAGLAVLAAAIAEPAPYGVMSLRRMAWLWLAATLAVFSWAGAEPYGRYLAGALPPLAYLGGRWISGLAGGRGWAVAGLCALATATNWLGWAPLAAARALAAPAVPAESVSGMMRARLRDAAPRSDFARLAGELARGPEGYLEAASAAIAAGGGGRVFTDADELSLRFASGATPVYPRELESAPPDWILPSPWLSLDREASDWVARAVASGGYAPVPVTAPRLLWQNNPDPLFRDFAPDRGPLPLYRRVSPGPSGE
jgi:hypothetical protein